MFLTFAGQSFNVKSFCVLLAKSLPARKPSEESPERRLLKTSNARKTLGQKHAKRLNIKIALVFCEKLNATLSNLNKSNKKVSNIRRSEPKHMAGCNQHPHAKEYLNILSSNAAFPLITKPNRITSTSSILQDHIITNITQNTLLTGILRSDLSDHFPTFCFILLDSKLSKNTGNKKIQSVYINSNQ